MSKKELKEICNYIKDNPKCIILYCDKSNFVIYKSNAHYVSRHKELSGDSVWYDYNIVDLSEDYIPFITTILLDCVKKGIDISGIKIKSC